MLPHEKSMRTRKKKYKEHEGTKPISHEKSMRTKKKKIQGA